MDTFKAEFLEVAQNEETFILTKLPARLVTDISYAAVRGQSKEAGAIQRLLNAKRITSIKNFTLAGGDYPGSIILNWVNKDNEIARNGSTVLIPEEFGSAQIIDGQHRLAGIAAAIEEQSDFGDLELAVAIYEHLDTKKCADIFLSINTEQKPVPRSLVFDLYGIASEALIDPAAVRARDVAVALNEQEDSPYRGRLKFPGSPIKKGGIALSTAVSALKPLVEKDGIFDQVGITELELQTQVVINYFNVLRGKYGSKWESKDNAFQYASGFAGAIDFLHFKVIPYCNKDKDFRVEAISPAILLEESNLIVQSEVKGLGGKEAPKTIYKRLQEAFHHEGSDKANLLI